MKRFWRLFSTGFFLLLTFALSGAANAHANDADVSQQLDADAHVKAQSVARRVAKKKRQSTRRRSTQRKRTPKRKRQAKVEIPIDIGVGAIALLPNPPLFGEQPVHPALMITTGALIDGGTLRKNKKRLPKQYRNLANGVGRVRVRPLWAALIPSQIIVSPGKALGLSGTDLYGGIWHPLGLGISPIQTKKFRVYAGAHLTGLLGYLNSSQYGSTFLLRPGLGAELHAELEFTKRFAITTGWSSDVFIPQALGKSPLNVLPLSESLYHLGGPFLRLHFRIPYQMQL